MTKKLLEVIQACASSCNLCEKSAWGKVLQTCFIMNLILCYSALRQKACSKVQGKIFLIRVLLKVLWITCVISSFSLQSQIFLYLKPIKTKMRDTSWGNEKVNIVPDWGGWLTCNGNYITIGFALWCTDFSKQRFWNKFQWSWKRETGTGAWMDDSLAKRKPTDFFAIVVKQIIQNRSFHCLTFCPKNTESSYAS